MPKDLEWTPIYETKSSIDADLIRTTLEVAGYRVSIDRVRQGPMVVSDEVAQTLTISVPREDANDARQFLRAKTSWSEAPPPPSEESAFGEPVAAQVDGEKQIEDAAEEVLELRRSHEVAACKYCGIPTLDLSELELDSRRIALLRAAGLGVNTATFSEFEAGERICSDCAGHEVSCDLCGRTLDAFIDEGEYRQVKDDEAYVCLRCIDRLSTQLDDNRDW